MRMRRQVWSDVTWNPWRCEEINTVCYSRCYYRCCFLYCLCYCRFCCLYCLCQCLCCCRCCCRCCCLYCLCQCRWVCLLLSLLLCVIGAVIVSVLCSVNNKIISVVKCSSWLQSCSPFSLSVCLLFYSPFFLLSLASFSLSCSIHARKRDYIEGRGACKCACACVCERQRKKKTERENVWKNITHYTTPGRPQKTSNRILLLFLVRANRNVISIWRRAKNKHLTNALKYKEFYCAVYKILL